MRILVTGGRDFNDRNLLQSTLNKLHSNYCFTLLIHGNARGADRLAGKWAEDRGINVLSCPADWERHGRAAGCIRNRRMLREGPDLVVGFPGGKGTRNMIEIATRAGIDVIEVSYDLS